MWSWLHEIAGDRRAAPRCRSPAYAEPLETRRLLSGGHPGSPPAPLDVLGTYGGASHVRFSPAFFHAPAADSISLTLSNEGKAGAVTGTLTDQFGGSFKIVGALRGRRLFLRAGNGRVTGRLGSDGIVLIGAFELSSGSGTRASWHGRFVLERLRGAAGLFSRYVGTAHGTACSNGLHGECSRAVRGFSITIVSQAANGSFTADVEGLPVSDSVVGMVIGRELHMHYVPRTPVDVQSSLGGTVSPDGRVITGSYDDECDPLITYEQASFTLRAML